MSLWPLDPWRWLPMKKKVSGISGFMLWTLASEAHPLPHPHQVKPQDLGAVCSHPQPYHTASLTTGALPRLSLEKWVSGFPAGQLWFPGPRPCRNIPTTKPRDPRTGFPHLWPSPTAPMKTRALILITPGQEPPKTYQWLPEIQPRLH